jgi:hypothetical protein
MIYLAGYFFLSLLAIFDRKIKQKIFFKIFILIFFLLFIATRLNTGGDWTAYKIYYEQINQVQYEIYDLSFYSLNNFIYIFLGTDGVFLKDFIISIFFLTLFFLFILKNFSDTFFLLALSLPILIILLGMGYIRQGLSVSCFLAFISFKEYRYKLFFLFPMLTFHAFGFILFCIIICDLFKRVFFKKNFLIHLKVFLFLFLLIFLSALLYLYFDILLLKYRHYINESHLYVSIGSAPRSFLNYVCAILYLFVYYFKNKIICQKFDFIFFIVSILILILFPLSFYFQTAVDRIGVGFSFIQLVGPYYFIKYFNNSKIEKLLKCCFLITFFLIFFTWVNFSTNYFNWIYQNLFFFI